MAIVRVFKSGNSQAVRLPKEFRFDVDEVELIQRGDELVLRKPVRTLGELLAKLKPLPVDFEWERPTDPPPAPVRGWEEWEADLQSEKSRSASRKPKSTPKHAIHKMA